MKKTLTEQQVLKKLEIPDFRHLTKNKVIKFASMIPTMDPDVAKKALEQFPEFSKTTLEMLDEYKEILEKGVEANTTNIVACNEACTLIISSLQKELDKEEHSFEEKKYIIDKMVEISKMMNEKDTENKKFLMGLSVVAGFVVLGVVNIAASMLGEKIDLETSESDED